MSRAAAKVVGACESSLPLPEKEVCVMYWRSSRSLLEIGCLAIVVASLAALLVVSFTRDFLPGKVELTAVFAAGIVVIIAVMLGYGNRREVLKRVLNPPGNELAATAVLAVSLAITASLAGAFSNFPWPVGLLVGTVIALGVLARGAAARAK